jgi:hypothetical protein
VGYNTLSSQRTNETRTLTPELVYAHVASLAFPCADCGLDQQPKLLEIPLQDVYSAIWKRAQPDTNILFEPTIQGALEVARKIGKEHGGMQSLITGSLRLVGGALSLLQPYLSAQECIH